MSTIERPAVAVEDDWYVWPVEVDWRFYSGMLRLRGDSRVPRMVYLDGDLILMTPSQPHEERKERLGLPSSKDFVGGGSVPRSGDTSKRKPLS